MVTSQGIKDFLEQEAASTRNGRSASIGIGKEIQGFLLPLPCAYVRWLPEIDAFYVGRAKDLRKRYRSMCLDQVIYWEEIPDPTDRAVREAQLLKEFRDAGLPLANVDMLSENMSGGGGPYNGRYGKNRSNSVSDCEGRRVRISSAA